jgi:hypothetical protein
MNHVFSLFFVIAVLPVASAGTIIKKQNLDAPNVVSHNRGAGQFNPQSQPLSQQQLWESLRLTLSAYRFSFPRNNHANDIFSSRAINAS